MTVNTTTSRVSYAGDGSSTTFAVPFYFLASSHLRVVLRAADGTETTQTLSTDYTVSGAGNPAGGSITMTTAPISGVTVVISRNVPQTQLVDYQSNDPFPAATHEAALDQLTMEVQQLQLQVDRAVKTAETDSTSLSTSLPASNLRANKALVFDSQGQVGVSLDDFNNSATQAATYAGNAAVSASNAASSATAAAASYNTFLGTYYGALSADPALDPLGNAITAGDLYYSTTLSRMRVYSSGAWTDVGVTAPVTITTQTLSGNASTTAFTLSSAPSSVQATEVYISGVAQRPTTDYTVSGTTLTFTTAPATGTNNILVRWVSSYSIGVPNDGSVTTAKLQDTAVTTAKLADANVTTAKIADSAITSAKIADGAIATADIAAGAVTLAKLDQTGTSGYLLTAQGAGAAPQWTVAPTSGFVNMVAYTTAGTTSWTIPSGITRCKVTVVGGGGGGAACSSSGAGGGGAGGYSTKIITGLVGGGSNSLTVTVGAAGIAGTGTGTPATGGTGGTSSVSSGTNNTISSVSATGGQGGKASTPYAGGTGGSGSGGTLNASGGGGGSGGSGGSSSYISGAGGSSVFGGGAASVGNGSPGAGIAGSAGGGGSGAAHSSANRDGGAGGAGVVLIEY